MLSLCNAVQKMRPHVSVLVCTRGAAFEMNWWKFGERFSRYYNSTHIYLRACMY